MKYKIIDKPYFSGGAKPDFDELFDYMLFRQDFYGAELVFFNADESWLVCDKVMSGEIIIHHNYSILYCKTQSLLDSAPDLGCHSILWEK